MAVITLPGYETLVKNAVYGRPDGNDRMHVAAIRRCDTPTINGVLNYISKEAKRAETHSADKGKTHAGNRSPGRDILMHFCSEHNKQFREIRDQSICRGDKDL